MTRLLRYASPERWRRFIASQIELVRRLRGDNALDAAWRSIGPVRAGAGPATVVADGLWLNPGHFFRLRLVVEALARTESFAMLGVLRKPDNIREKRALQRIGFSEFVHVEADQEFPVAAFDAEAKALLAGVKSHDELLRIQLPHGFPAYFWYDSVLKDIRHGRPPVDHPGWRKSLAETLACMAIYERLLAEKKVSHVLLSHAWGSEWAVLAWLALGRGTPVFLLTAFSSAIRVRRFRTREDLDIPVEFLSRSSFDALPIEVRRKIIDFGADQLQQRQANQTRDVNIRHAYVPEARTTDRAEARSMLGITDDRPIGVIYGHAWFDFPHLYGMRNFTDFVDWFEVTLPRISEIENVTWLLKPHPMEGWYGGQKMTDNIAALPPHVRVIANHVDTLTVMSAADAIITVHGTAALEAAAHGIPVIAADRSYYTDWGFVHVAPDRAAYLKLLGCVGEFGTLTSEQRELAQACFALAYSEPAADAGALWVPCDSLGAELSEWIRVTVTSKPQIMAAEVDRLADFLAQDKFDAFAAYGVVRSAACRKEDVAASW